jgi:hypothetical protein
MQLDKSITIGNIVSWVLILVGLGMGYAKLESATVQNSKDVRAATELAQKVESSQREIDAVRNSQINSLTVSMAETAITVRFMDKKLDELIIAARK